MQSFLITRLNEQMETIHGQSVEGTDASYRYIWVDILGRCGGQAFNGKDKTDAVALALRIRDSKEDVVEIDKEEKRLIEKVVEHCHLNAAACVFLTNSILEKIDESVE